MDFTVTKIADNLYEFTESADFAGNGHPVPYVDSYLYIGDSRAAVIDTLQNAKGLYAAVREITSLPVDVLITHGHGDHVGASTAEFAEAGCRVYMDMADYKFLNPDAVKKEWFTDMQNGETFDLGGITLEAISCPGHTPGSMVFLDRAHQVIFTGDTVGSGHFWMQIPTAIPLSRFLPGVKALWETVKPYEGLLVYPGHRNQSPVQLTGQYIKDCCTATERIINGTLDAETQVMPHRTGELRYKSVSHGMMLDYRYNPDAVLHPAPDPAVEAIKDKFTRESIRSGSRTMDYMLFTPETEPGKVYPLVIFLHGAGERGSDPRLALANPGGTTFASDEWQKDHPCFVAAPQVADGEWWTDDWYMDVLARLVMQMARSGQYPVDASRVYITGLSMGGMGTWKMIARYPSLFAAAMPVCGAGDPVEVRAAKDVPVWAFVAADDPVAFAYGYLTDKYAVGLVGSRWLVNALRGAGGTDVHYTEYPAGWMAEQGLFPHASWVPAYQDKAALEWLFSHKTTDRYEMHFVQPGFWWVDDATGSSLYIIEGTERALVVDTGMADNDFIGMVKSLTRLPFDLAVTHCHGDHMYHLDKFDRYYMSEKDLPLLDAPFMKGMLGDRTFNAELMPVKDGDIIDLGGGYEVEVFTLGGHTPGSVVYLDRKRKIALTGDALGVWMQVPGATDLSVYRAELAHFLERMSAPEYEGVVMMAGHRKQEGCYFPYGDRYVPNDLQKVRDMITLVDKLMAEEIAFTPFTMRAFDEPAFTASFGQASIVFTESRLK